MPGTRARNVKPEIPARLVRVPADDLCLAYADTRYWRGSDPATETLHSADALLRWCVAANVLDDVSRHALSGWMVAHATEAETLFVEAVAAREAIYALFARIAAEGSGRSDDISLLNDLLARAPQRAEIGAATDGRFMWRLPASRPGVATILAPVLWSMADLLVGDRCSRVRVCANEKCRWLFLDDSKSGTRRWCSMSACGNRAKAHRHYLRTRQSRARASTD